MFELSVGSSCARRFWACLRYRGPGLVALYGDDGAEDDIERDGYLRGIGRKTRGRGIDDGVSVDGVERTVDGDGAVEVDNGVVDEDEVDEDIVTDWDGIVG